MVGRKDVGGRLVVVVAVVAVVVAVVALVVVALVVVKGRMPIISVWSPLPPLPQD